MKKKPHAKNPTARKRDPNAKVLAAVQALSARLDAVCDRVTRLEAMILDLVSRPREGPSPGLPQKLIWPYIPSPTAPWQPGWFPGDDIVCSSPTYTTRLAGGVR
jgi:hypothetical protein